MTGKQFSPFTIFFTAFIDIMHENIKLDTYELRGGERRQFYILHIYDIKFSPEKGYWVPYSRGQLTASPNSDTVKVSVSNRN